MFHGAGQAVRRSWSVHKCFTGIVSRLLFRFVRFRYARSVPPLLFWLVLRLGCVLWCVVFVLRLLNGVSRGVCVCLDKIYGFSFFARLRAYFGACLVLAFVRACRPSIVAGGARPYKTKSTIPPILPYYSPNKIFFTFKG